MDAQTLREWVGHVKMGRLSRRTFVQTMLTFRQASLTSSNSRH